MIASNDNRRFDFAAFDQFIHRDAELCTLAITEPADARGQPLKLDPLFRQFHPARKRLVFRKQVECEPIGARDVFRVATQCNPAERATSFAKERPNVFWNETGNIKCVLDARFLRLSANVVSIIKSHYAFFLQREHRLNMNSHRTHGALDVVVWIFRSEGERVLQRHSVWNVAVQRIMCTGLIGENIWNDATLYDFRQDIGAVSDEAD